MEWQTIDRPGYFGERKPEIYEQYDAKYGAGNWRIMWLWEGITIKWMDACLLYEDAYYHDSKQREGLWQKLISEAKDVYDNNISNIESKLDYIIQETAATHIQDIAIRRVVLLRHGWEFLGNKLMQIRSNSKSKYGRQLSPGRVPFHQPEFIEEPPLEGEHWWDLDSIEDFYQRNKVLQVRK